MKGEILEKKAEQINILQQEIQGLHQQINNKTFEIEDIYTECGLVFENSYAEYFDGNDYVFMKVEHQNNRVINGHHCLLLEGPSIKLSDNPLTEALDENENITGSYNDMEEIAVDSKIFFEDVTYKTLRKITKKDMDKALNVWVKIMRHNLN